MNDLINLKGKFNQKSRSPGFGPRKLKKGTSVSVDKLIRLQNDLLRLHEFWMNEKYLEGALISVFYKRVIPKSKRVQGYFSKGSHNAIDSIVGARFIETNQKKKHVITHYISMDIFEETLFRINKAIEIVSNKFGKEITSEQIENIKLLIKDEEFESYGLARSNFMNVVVDSYYVDKFDVVDNRKEFKESSIINVYETDVETKELLKRIGIDVLSSRVLDNTTLLLTPDQLSLLYSKAPYLVSMATEDISKLTKIDFSHIETSFTRSIPSPKDEPIIGVIDTLFDERVYFSKWVEYHNMLPEDIPTDIDDYRHGTSVSSIIVDGHRINPELDDGCGNFRVRHFGVASSKEFSSFSIVRAIQEIVSQNRDIKVWNLSLGSKKEVDKNFISPEAAILDTIQYENDVMFIISGTNKSKNDPKDKAIGSPADSINSLIVNAVDENNKVTDYARKGIVLSFFNKPDVSYFGGSKSKYMKVCGPFGEASVCGTSFAAPWIARKMAYLIHVLGLSREVAKAVLIDSAIKWKSEYSINEASLLGHGIVPKRIEDVIKSHDDEIKFVISGISEKYDSYNYNIPVPYTQDGHPFVAKATLCYFPKCSRNQGVDYTNTELDIYFGRIKGNTIKSIDKNKQSIENTISYLFEDNARRLFRKWDNSKHIKEIYTSRKRVKKAYDTKMWGISIKSKNRLNGKDGEGLRFGIVVTLKEIDGVNRFETFIQQCSLRGWLVNRIDVDNRIDIYHQANEEITFD